MLISVRMQKRQHAQSRRSVLLLITFRQRSTAMFTPAAICTMYRLTPSSQISFSQPINQSTVAAGVSLTGAGTVASTFSYPNDSTLVIQPSSPLNPLTKYLLVVSPPLKSTADSSLTTTAQITFVTAIDTTDKFPRISDSALLTLVEQQTFNYFWSGCRRQQRHGERTRLPNRRSPLAAAVSGSCPCS